MATWTCERCSSTFIRDKSGTRPIRFCCVGCFHAWLSTQPRRGTFKKGQDPWNKGIKGIHLSPTSEFRKGCESNRKLGVGSERVRLDKNTKTPRTWVKIKDPRTWKLKAVIVWEEHNGKTPHNMVIHHLDGNSLNDDISNLRCLTRSEHIEAHRQDLIKSKTKPVNIDSISPATDDSKHDSPHQAQSTDNKPPAVL